MDPVTRHWSWQTSPDHYPQLFGEIAANLAARLNASHVLFAANCVDDEELEKELRSAGFLVHPPQRKKRWLATVSRGSLDAWRVVPRLEAATTPQLLWQGISSVYGFPAEHPGGLDHWSDVEALMGSQQPHLVSHDADCVTVDAPANLEQELVAEALAAAERAGGNITER